MVPDSWLPSSSNVLSVVRAYKSDGMGPLMSLLDSCKVLRLVSWLNSLGMRPVSVQVSRIKICKSIRSPMRVDNVEGEKLLVSRSNVSS